MPTRRDLLSVSAILPMAACAKAASPPSPTPYAVFEPSMARYVAVAASRSYPYNHASSIIGYQGWYFLLWNASGSIEGADGQVILMKRAATLDGLAGAPMEPCFPAIPARTAAQWQPGTCVVGDELWALWSQSGREGVGTYFSRLKSRGGSFETERLQASTLDRDGIHYDSAFITGDIIPLTLPNGQTRHLAPVVYQSSAAVTPSALMPNASMGKFAARRKLAGVLYNDGAGWEVGGLITQPRQPWSPWEPFLSVQEDGKLRLWVRNLNVYDQSGSMMLTALSDDHGLSFSSLEPAGVEVPSTRGAAAVLGNGSDVLVQNDNPVKGGEAFSPSARRNLALWMEVGEDFQPGIAISDDAADRSPCYPSLGQIGRQLVVSYSCYDRSSANMPSTIKMVAFDAPPSSGLIMPRSNARNLRSPQLVSSPNPHFLYRGYSRLSTVGKVDETGVSPSVQTLVAQIDPTDYGVIYDCRGAKGTGWLVRISDCLIIGFYGPDGTFKEITSNVPTPIGSPLQVRVTVDAAARSVQADVNGSSQKIDLQFAPASLAPAAVAFIGCANPSSALGAIAGKIRSVKVYSGSQAVGSPAIDFDAGNPKPKLFGAFGSSDGAVQVVNRSGRVALRINGTASASVVPPAGSSTTGFEFEYEPASGRSSEATLCTLGNVLDCVMVVISPDGRVALRRIEGGRSQPDRIIVSGVTAGTLHRVRLLMSGGLVAVEHDQSGPTHVAAPSHPMFFLGRAWSPQASPRTNDIFVFVDAVRSNM